MARKRSVKRPRSAVVDAVVDDYPELARGETGGELVRSHPAPELGEKRVQAPAADKEAMADAMQKILGKTLSSDTEPILGKAGKIETMDAEQRKQEKKRRLERQRAKEERQRDHASELEDTSYEFEAKLRRIATKGAVVLFNAVRKQQSADQAPSEGKAQASDKKSFIEKLVKQTQVTTAQGQRSQERSNAPGWKALDDEFMLKGKPSDWEEEGEGEEDDDSLEDSD